jgi:hypothetical protein
LVTAHGFEVGRFLGGRCKDFGKFHEKERILKDIEFELFLRQGAVSQALHEGMGKLGVPDKL